MILCSTCNKQTTNPKYCSRSCSAKANKLCQRKDRFCKRCGVFISKGWTTAKFCSSCRSRLADWSKVTLQQFFDKLPKFQANARIRGLARQTFRRHNKSTQCYSCGYSKFVEVCHIKAIASFERNTPISVVNDISNLVALCPNCHWEFDNKVLQLCEKNSLV